MRRGEDGSHYLKHRITYTLRKGGAARGQVSMQAIGEWAEQHTA